MFPAKIKQSIWNIVLIIDPHYIHFVQTRLEDH